MNKINLRLNFNNISLKELSKLLQKSYPFSTSSPLPPFFMNGVWGEAYVGKVLTVFLKYTILDSYSRQIVPLYFITGDSVAAKQQEFIFENDIIPVIFEDGVEYLNKNDLGSLISEMIEKYQSFLSTLTLEQHVILFNLIGLISLLYISISIFSIFFGNKIIDRLNLQSHFPKLAKFILFRQKVSEYNYITLIIMFYCTGLLWILGNIYMFLLPYFV